jgi:hypothetical protein
LADVALRRICGWESQREIPHESVFSRTFAEFAETELPQRLHAALIKETHKDRLIGHISRDSTEIEAREKPLRPPVAPEAVQPAAKKKARRKKGEPPAAPEPTRLERQSGMTLQQMLADCRAPAMWAARRTAKDIRRLGWVISCIWTWRTVRFRSVAF